MNFVSMYKVKNTYFTIFVCSRMLNENFLTNMNGIKETIHFNRNIRIQKISDKYECVRMVVAT